MHLYVLETNSIQAVTNVLLGLPEVPQEMALERLEQMVGIAAGCLATFVNIPLQGKFAADGKKKVGQFRSDDTNLHLMARKKSIMIC